MQENTNPHQSRLNLLFILVFLSLATIILRLSFLQIVDGEKYRTTAELHRTVDQTIPAPRGLIYDRNHQLLVGSEPSFSVQYNILGDNSQKQELIAAKLVPFLKKQGETDPQTIKRLVDKMNDPALYTSTPRPLAEHVDQKTVAFVMEHLEELPGVNIQVIPQRKYYPADNAGAHVLGHLAHINSTQWEALKDKGYQQTDKIGNYGLEAQYESELRGKDGTQTVEVNRNYEPITSYQTTHPQRGHDLVLNIDEGLQETVSQALSDQVKYLQQKYPQQGIKNAAAVAIDPNTGDVLAIGSYPEFNPNAWASGNISESDYQEYSKAEMNHAVQAPYPPGSTVKPITVMMGLKAGVITPSFTVWDPGYLYVGTQKMYNWWHPGDGTVNAERALARSNNTYMGTVMLRLGGYPPRKNLNDWLSNDLPKTIDMVHNYHKQMGLGVSSGIDLPEEVSGMWNFDGQLFTLAEMGIGQNMAYPASQIAQYCGMLANGGNRMELHIVHQIDQGVTDPNTGQETEKVLRTIEPKVLNQMPFSQEELDLVRKGMWGVTHSPEGTAYSVFLGAPYDVSAKTGTSENGNNSENSLFMGFMPSNKPTIAIAIVIPNVPTTGHSYELVGPISRKIMDKWWAEKYASSAAPAPASH